jgi:hypothetical protein
MEMRIKADGRTSKKDNSINEKHADFASALYMAERKSREAL